MLHRVAVGLSCVLCVFAAAGSSATTIGVRAQDAPGAVSFEIFTHSPQAAFLHERIYQTKDNHGMPYAIVDKINARVYAFDGDGRFAGHSSVLLGLAKGDDSAPGIGNKKMAEITPAERTTPAGRFVVEPGRNTQGDDIVWIDYDAAVSMHRVRTANKSDRRLERLATLTVTDNRISYGCINVPTAFYDAHIRDGIGKLGGIVYVLPETRSLAAQFGGLVNSKGR